MLMDLMGKYFTDSYAVVTSLTYDATTRTLILECADEPGSKRASRRIILTNIQEYAQEVDDDPEIGELLIGFDADGDGYCIRTESREIIIKTDCSPNLEFLK